MGFFSYIRLNRLYKMICKNENVIPDRSLNREYYKIKYPNESKRKKVISRKQNLVLVVAPKKDHFIIIFKYKLNEDSYPMRVCYDLRNEYKIHIFAEAENTYFVDKLNERDGHSKFLAIKSLEDILRQRPPEILGKDITLNSKKDQQNKVDGILLSMEEIYSKDISKFKKDLYDDLKGLAKSCKKIEEVDLEKNIDTLSYS